MRKTATRAVKPMDCIPGLSALERTRAKMCRVELSRPPTRLKEAKLPVINIRAKAGATARPPQLVLTTPPVLEQPLGEVAPDSISIRENGGGLIKVRKPTVAEFREPAETKMVRGKVAMVRRVAGSGIQVSPPKEGKRITPVLVRSLPRAAVNPGPMRLMPEAANIPGRLTIKAKARGRVPISSLSPAIRVRAAAIKPRAKEPGHDDVKGGGLTGRKIPAARKRRAVRDSNRPRQGTAAKHRAGGLARAKNTGNIRENNRRADKVAADQRTDSSSNKFSSSSNSNSKKARRNKASSSNS